MSSGTLTGTAVNLQPSQDKTYQVKVAVPATLAPDDYYFFAVVDSGNKFGGSNRTDNILLAPQTTTLVAPVVDLTGSFNMNIADQIIGSGTGTAAVNVVNQGNVAAVGKMNITLYASSDGTYDPTSDAVVGTLTGTAVNLQPSQDKTYQVNVTMPATLAAGDYYFYAVVDSGNKFDSSSQTDNILLAPQTTTLLAPTVDLSVNFDSVGLSSTPNVGDTGTAYLDISNIGNIKAAGRLTIQVYACQNPTLDNTAVLLGASTGKAVVVAAGATTTYGVNLTVPQSLAGNSWFLVVQISYTGTVPDTDSLDKTALSDTTLDVQSAPTPSVSATHKH